MDAVELTATQTHPLCGCWPLICTPPAPVATPFHLSLTILFHLPLPHSAFPHPISHLTTAATPSSAALAFLEMLQPSCQWCKSVQFLVLQKCFNKYHKAGCTSPSAMNLKASVVKEIMLLIETDHCHLPIFSLFGKQERWCSLLISVTFWNSKYLHYWIEFQPSWIPTSFWEKNKKALNSSFSGGALQKHITKMDSACHFVVLVIFLKKYLSIHA